MRNRTKGFTLTELLIGIIIIGVILVAVFGGIFGDDSDAIRAAEAQGFKDVQVVSTHRWYSARWHGCGDDWKATVINATNPVGKKVEITVCEGYWFKGATIRH